MREIDIDVAIGATAAESAVKANEADYTGIVPLDHVKALERRYGAAAGDERRRYFSGPVPVVHMFAFNVERPLFAAARMRQAVNAALDRPALAAGVHSGNATVPGRATDQLVPPGIPGFRDVQVYSVRAPDVGRARRLAGIRARRRAVLLTCNEPSCLNQARVLQRDLAAIGIDLTIDRASVAHMFDLQPLGRWDITYMNWFPDFLDSSDYIDGLFGDPSGFPGHFRDAALSRRMRAAIRLPGAARHAAFARLDEDLARAGAAAPFATAVSTDFFSDRIGCQVHQPMYGISLGALCVRK
jgi:ABC-type oligopeptide transport system substrate-binding subunit